MSDNLKVCYINECEIYMRNICTKKYLIFIKNALLRILIDYTFSNVHII